MTTSDAETGQGQTASDAEFDDLRNLYIATIRDVPGEIETNQGRLAASFSGEILVYGKLSGDLFVIQRVRRVALYGALKKPDEDPNVGVFSLAGPLDVGAISPGSIDQLLMQLHYDALSLKLDPLIKSVDAEFPQLERIAGALEWRQANQATDRNVPLEVRLEFARLIGPLLGVIQRVAIFPVLLNFRLAAAPGPATLAFALTAAGNCSPPITPCPGGTNTKKRDLRLRFLDFTASGVPVSVSASVIAACQLQADGLCQVWRTLAALDPQIEVEVGPLGTAQILVLSGSTLQRTVFQSFVEGDQSKIPYPPNSAPPAGESHAKTDPDWVEIYVVGSIAVSNGGGGITNGGGGVAYRSGTASAFCVLEIGAMTLNPYLLCHELGHVIGLGHPNGAAGLLPSSPGSVMEAATPNPPLNTLLNCAAFTARSGSLPYNPLVFTSNQDDCFRPNA